MPRPGWAAETTDLAKFSFLVILSIFVILELATPEGMGLVRGEFLTGESTFTLQIRYVIALVIFCVGVTLLTATRNEAVIQALLGGSVFWLICYGSDRVYRLLRGSFGIDQGTLVAAFIVGLYVTIDNLFWLVILWPIFTLIVYGIFAFVRGIRLEMRTNVLSVPFLVVTMIVIGSPYFRQLDAAFDGIAYPDQIQAIRDLLTVMKAKDRPFVKHAEGAAEITIHYIRERLPVDSLTLNCSVEHPGFTQLLLDSMPPSRGRIAFAQLECPLKFVVRRVPFVRAFDVGAVPHAVAEQSAERKGVSEETGDETGAIRSFVKCASIGCPSLDAIATATANVQIKYEWRSPVASALSNRYKNVQSLSVRDRLRTLGGGSQSQQRYSDEITNVIFVVDCVYYVSDVGEQ